MHDIVLLPSTRAWQPIAQHLTIRIDTDAPRQFVDITERVARIVVRCRLDTGTVNVQTRHTTTGIVINEHEPLLLDDMCDALERYAPVSATYRHDDLGVRQVNLEPGERRNGHAHCQSLVLRASECVNVVGGLLDLGRWQRLFFVELDGPQSRQVSVVVLGRRRPPPTAHRPPAAPGR
jgi:secondary thiamine-phosphate synthase enzyme